MISKLKSFLFLFTVFALAFWAAAALSGDERTGHYDVIEMPSGGFTTTVRPADAPGSNVTFKYPEDNGTSNFVLRQSAGGTQWVDAINTLSPADGSTNGYLSSADWTSFTGAATATTAATSVNTASTIVKRDSSGNIAVSGITATSISGMSTPLSVAQGGTALASGTSGGVLAYTASGVLASSGALTANAVVIGGGAGVVPTIVTNNSTGTTKFLNQASSGTPAWSQIAIGSDVTGLGSGVATFLATPSSSNLAGAVTDETGSGALVFGTAPAITLGNGTGLPISTGVSGLGTGVATFLATPSSANLASALTDETGSGAAVFGTTPTIATPEVTTYAHFPSNSEIRFSDAGNNTLYVGFKATTLSGSQIWSLPTADGSASQVLKTDGSGALGWASPFVNPMTTLGDTMYGATGGTVTRLAGNTLLNRRYLRQAGDGVGSLAPVWDTVVLTDGVSGTLPIANGGTAATTKAGAFDSLSPMTAAGDTIYGGTSGTGTTLVKGTSVQVLHSGTTPSWSAVSLTADVSGVLPLANGGTNKNMTAAAGGLVWTDSDSQEVGAAGTTSDWALSGGTGAPTFSSTTTTAKFIDGSADAVQMRVQGHSTQSSDILAVEKSDSTLLFEVTNTGGTLIRGDTVGTAPATGFVGEILTNANSSQACSTTGHYRSTNEATVTLTPGTWDINGCADFIPASTTAYTRFDIGYSTTSGDSFPDAVNLQNQLIRNSATSVPTDEVSICGPTYRKTVTTNTAIYVKALISFTVNTCNDKEFIRATRIK